MNDKDEKRIEEELDKVTGGSDITAAKSDRINDTSGTSGDVRIHSGGIVNGVLGVRAKPTSGVL